MTKPIQVLALIAIAPVLAGAEGGTVLSGPVAGYLFMPEAGVIRPMLGVPGSAWLGEPLAAGMDLAATAPNGKLALAIRGARLFLLNHLDQAQPEWVELGPAPEAADRIVWNATATAAAVASSASGTVQLWRSLDRSPQAGDPLSFGSTVTSLAVDASGAIAAGVSGEGLYLCRGADVRLVSRNPKVSALAFSGNDLYFADSTLGKIFVIRDYSLAGDATLFGALEDAVGLAVSGDGARLAALSASTKTLTLFDLKTLSTPQTVELEFTPTGAAQFSGDSLYIVNAGAQGPVQLLDMSRGAAVYFVPTGAKEE